MGDASFGGCRRVTTGCCGGHSAARNRAVQLSTPIGLLQVHHAGVSFSTADKLQTAACDEGICRPWKPHSSLTQPLPLFFN
ncbi:hypothetical protein RB195_015037 [Necator americanus]|uniref:Uncharacterized protein n=1 Tax=Necator americanus TaxID=51031 RepID=A0ABR1E2Q6_NECAM